MASGSFELRNTRNGIKMLAQEMADYSAIMRHIDARTLLYFTYHPKSLKPVIRHLPEDTPAEDQMSWWHLALVLSASAT
jgi:hypothetical protein